MNVERRHAGRTIRKRNRYATALQRRATERGITLEPWQVELGAQTLALVKEGGR